MINLNNLQQIITESAALPPTPNLIREDYLQWLESAKTSKLIKAITGFRRSGKSHLLKSFSQRLIDDGLPHSNLLYLNFEHDLLLEVDNVTKLRNLFDFYLHNIAQANHPIYIIWDEIQQVKNWEKLVRTLYETGLYQIYLSGSNSELLSGELSSTLAGRSLSLEVFPFSFKEYLAYLSTPSDSLQHKTEVDRAFHIYLCRGGIAEQFNIDQELAANYKEGLINKIILDDIAKRYQVDKVQVLQQLFQFTAGNITSTLSVKNTVNRLAEAGVKVTAQTINSYLYYWQTAYAIFKVQKFDYKLSRVFDHMGKYYVVDNLLISGRADNDEKRLENLVFLELLRRHNHQNIYFGQDKNGYELDFVVDGEQKCFYQVCLELNDHNVSRELGNLHLAQKHQSGQCRLLYLYDHRSQPTHHDFLQPVVPWLISADATC